MTASQINHPETSTIEEKEAFHRFLWTSGIIGLFCIQGIIWIIAIAMTSRDASHAVLPDYERRSLGWDDHQDKLRKSRALGWTCAAELLSVENGRTILAIRLRDRNGTKLTGVQVIGTGFHCARAAEIEDLIFEETEAGTYTCSPGKMAPGIWQFSLQGRLGESLFIHDFRIETSATGGK